jgi:hypothetical protein
MTRAMVVYETMFGDAQQIAVAIAGELASLGGPVSTYEVGEAPDELPDDLELLVIGGPTHAFGMSTVSTRDQAAQRGGGRVPISRDRGIREWLEVLQPPAGQCHAAAFDTQMDEPGLLHVVDHAARSMEKRLRTRGFELAASAEHFRVLDVTGPLKDGEVERARMWARKLAREVVARE